MFFPDRASAQGSLCVFRAFGSVPEAGLREHGGLNLSCFYVFSENGSKWVPLGSRVVRYFCRVFTSKTHLLEKLVEKVRVKIRVFLHGCDKKRVFLRID